MFLIVWGVPAFDKMGNLIRLNPKRKDEFAAALKEIWDHAQRPTRGRVARGRDARNVRG